MDYAIYSKVISGIQTVKSALNNEIIGVLVYGDDGSLRQYFENWGEYLLNCWRSND